MRITEHYCDQCGHMITDDAVNLTPGHYDFTFVGDYAGGEVTCSINFLMKDGQADMCPACAKDRLLNFALGRSQEPLPAIKVSPDDMPDYSTEAAVELGIPVAPPESPSLLDTLPKE